MSESVDIVVHEIKGPNNVRLVLDPRCYECPATVYAGPAGKLYSSYKQTMYYGRVGNNDDIIGLAGTQMRALELLSPSVRATISLAEKVRTKGLSY